MEKHIQYVAAPSLSVAKDKEWIKHAEDLGGGMWDDPMYEYDSTTITKVIKVEKFEDVEANWIESLPWFHPNHPPLDEDSEIKEYFKVEDLNASKRATILRTISDLKYTIQCRNSRIKELKEMLKGLK